MPDKTKSKTPRNFFQMFRKRGFSETLEILSQFPNNEIIQSNFFEQLITAKSYPNSFFRVKNDLLKSKIIGYKLNESNDKVIFLTEKGKEILSLLAQIENLINNESE
jgi:predicted transcriptional regulator